MCIRPYFTAFHVEHCRVFMELMDRIALGSKIRAARKAKGLTQKDLERISGVSERAIQDIEAGDGNPGLNNIESIEQALRIDILGFHEPKLPDLSHEDIGLAVMGLLKAGPARRAYVLFLATRNKAYLSRLSEKDRRAIQALDLI